MKKSLIIIAFTCFLSISNSMAQPYPDIAVEWVLQHGLNTPPNCENVWYVPGQDDTAPYISGIMQLGGWGWCIVLYGPETLDPNAWGCQNRDPNLYDEVYDQNTAADNFFRSSRWSVRHGGGILDIMATPPPEGWGWVGMQAGDVLVAVISGVPSATQILFVVSSAFGPLQFGADSVRLRSHDPDISGSLSSWVYANSGSPTYFVTCYLPLTSSAAPNDVIHMRNLGEKK
jgi:hypothetical protein